MRRILSGAAIAGIALAQQPIAANAAAQTKTANLAATATITAGCTAFTSTAGFAFGTLAIGGVGSATGGLSATCTSGVAVAVTFNDGANSASSSAYLKGGVPVSSIAYGVFQDAAGATAIGTTLNFTAGSTAQVMPVYAKTQVVPVDTGPGVYTDTIVATITF